MSPAGTTGLAAVVFDVDGTLVDSERDGHRVAFNLAFEEAGLPDRWDVDLYGQLLALTGGRRRLTHYLLSRGLGVSAAVSQAEQLHERKTAILCELIAAGVLPPRPGARRLLDRLTASGVEVHIATTGSRAWVEPLLERCFGKDRFGVIVTGSEITTLKPNAAVYLEVLRLSGHDATDCCAVEDSAPGVAAAVGAGLRCVAVTNHYTRGHDLSAASYVGRGLDDPGVVRWLTESSPASPTPPTTPMGDPRRRLREDVESNGLQEVPKCPTPSPAQ